MTTAEFEKNFAIFFEVYRMWRAPPDHCRLLPHLAINCWEWCYRTGFHIHITCQKAVYRLSQHIVSTGTLHCRFLHWWWWFCHHRCL